MALIKSENIEQTRHPLLADAVARVRSWLADGSDTSLARRMAGAAFLIRVASAILAYGSQVLFARWMGSSEFGIYVYVWTWVLLVGGIVDIGLASSAQRFIPEYTERRQFDFLRGFLVGARWLAFGVATAIGAAGVLGVLLLEPWLDHPVVVPLLLACAALPIYGLTHMQEGIARSYNWVNLSNLPPYVIRQIVLIALMGGAYLLGLTTDAVSATIMGVASYWIICAGQFLVLNRRLSRGIKHGPKAYDFKYWLAISLPIFLIETFYLLLMYSDVLILKQYAPPHEVAVYYAAAKTLALVAFVYYAVAQTAAHKFTELHVNGDRERLAHYIAHIVRLTFWPSFAATVLVLAFGVPLLWLFGRDFVDGYHLMFILAVGLLARAAVGPVERLLIMLDQHYVCALIYAAAFAINVVLCVLLIPHLGTAGAAASMSTALVVESILLYVVTKRRLGYHVFVFGRPRTPRADR
ncbi:MAG: oligosaccharide flippase family protein [Rhizobiales bacterium]|nr:oligosaccharide flippase family protein [Hyphomicrobiales bacterium]